MVLAEEACTAASAGWFKLALASILVAMLGAGLAVYSALSTQQPIVAQPDQPMKAEEPQKLAKVEPLMRLRATGFSHGDVVRHGAFSPDGNSLAFVDWQFDPKTGYMHVLHLRDLATGKDRWVSPPTGPFGPIAFSPDGKVLAAAQSIEIHLFDTATGKVLHRLTETREGFLGHYAILGLTFSPDGKHLAAVKYGMKDAGFSDIEIDKLIPLFDLWDVATGKPIRQTSGPNGRGYSLVGYRDGKLLAWERLGLSSSGRLLDLLTGQVHFSLIPHQQYVPFAVLSPDGKTCACPATAYGDYGVRRWDLATGQELPKLEGHNGSVVAIAFSPDGKVLASASADSTVRLWDAKTHKLLATLRGHTDRLACIAFSSDGRTLGSGGRDKAVRLWDVPEGELLHELTEHQGFLDSVFFSPDGTLLVSGATAINAKNEGIPEVIVWKLPAR
jgi:WD40 repeat protein